MKGSSVQSLGCSSVSKAWQARDGTTDKYGCYRNKSETQSIIVSPVHGRLSIAKSIRLYTSDSKAKQDPTSFALYGRVDSDLPWMEVSRGNFPGVDEGLPRNSQGIMINSTYKNGDDNLIYSEVEFPSNGAAYLDYKIEFTGFKDSSTSWFRFAEIELPGHLEASSTPTSSPSISPSKNVSRLNYNCMHFFFVYRLTCIHCSLLCIADKFSIGFTDAKSYRLSNVGANWLPHRRST